MNTPPNQPPGQPPPPYPPQPYMQQPGPDEITSTDKLWAALSYVFGILAIIALVMDTTKDRRFVKYHAVQALGLWAVYLVFNIALTVCNTLMATVLSGAASFLWCFFSLFYFVPLAIALYCAYQAYMGKYFQIPILTDFLAQQKWLQKPGT